MGLAQVSTDEVRKENAIVSELHGVYQQFVVLVGVCSTTAACVVEALCLWVLARMIRTRYLLT